MLAIKISSGGLVSSLDRRIDQVMPSDSAASSVTSDETLVRIGAVAEQMGISERTLRYYEEFGLVTPSSYSRGGSRLYDEAAIARVSRIRTLQSLMGFNLEEIRDILRAEDHLDEIRTEIKNSSKRKKSLYQDAIQTLEELQNKVAEKQASLQTFQDDLKAKMSRVMARLDELEKK